MFFKKEVRPEFGYRALFFYVGQQAVISREIAYGRGRAFMLDNTSWLVTSEFDCPIKTKVLVVAALDKLTLKVIPVLH